MTKVFPLVFALFGALIFQALGQSVDPAKVADYKQRFAKGKELAEKGKFQDALKIFKGILAEDPLAKGSLFMAGVTSNQLYEFNAAALYLDKFLDLEPQHTAALINAIKAHQASNDEAKVELYRARLFEKRRLKTDPVLNLMGSYERQRYALKDGGYLSILETFSPTGKEAFYSVIRLSAEQRIVSREELVPAPADASPEMKGSYLWAEPHYRNDMMDRYEIKKVVPSLPEYREVQSWITEEFADLIPKA